MTWTMRTELRGRLAATPVAMKEKYLRGDLVIEQFR